MTSGDYFMLYLRFRCGRTHLKASGRKLNATLYGHKFFDDTPGDWRHSRLLKPHVALENIREPTGIYHPLHEFIIDQSTYSLGSNLISTEGSESRTRLQYLQSDIVDHYFVGERAEHASIFFGDGSSRL
jgi:hypothetical protein